MAFRPLWLFAARTPARRWTNRRLALAAILHGSAIFVALVGLEMGDPNRMPSVIWPFYTFLILWTLWLLWPVVILLHPGRSFNNFAVPASFFVLFCLPLSIPKLVGFTVRNDRLIQVPPPWRVAAFGIGYAQGYFDGKSRVRANKLVLEDYGFGCSRPGWKTYAARGMPIEDIHVGTCYATEGRRGHLASNNKIVFAEIERRYGKEAVAELNPTPFGREQP